MNETQNYLNFKTSKMEGMQDEATTKEDLHSLKDEGITEHEKENQNPTAVESVMSESVI